MSRDEAVEKTRSAADESGFTIVEVLIAMSVLIVGLVALSGLLVTTSHSRQQVSQRHLVLERGQNIIEEIRAADPADLLTMYDSKTFDMFGVDGNNPDGSVIQVDVVAPDPSFLQVTVTGNWLLGQRSESLQLYTEIYDAK